MRTRVDTFIAHFRKRDGEIQSLEDHLKETAYLCSCFALEIGLPLCGRLLGLLHDIGKYSSTFQKYIRDVTGLNGEAAVAEAKLLRGKVDHATAGGQIVWRAYKANQIPCFVAQILSVVLISHHSRSGMKDFIDLKGRSPFLERLYRDECSTHCDEALRQCNSSILGEINHLLGSKGLVDELRDAIERIKPVFEESIPRYNAFSMLCRYLFSCLLDADRINTSDFENPRAADFRSNNIRPDWRSYVEQLENRLSKFSSSSDIDQLRSRISSECRDASGQKKNLFTLQVPTGGGKTLASLRFALHRALSPETHRVDRIIYVLPYTSILDQNASVARRIFGDEEVLEHHSNLSEERDTLRNRVLSENWDAPIVFTTSVQFLNTLFAGGTKTARRMHQLSNAILVFDEIQALPVKTIHLFNNAINFLCSQGNTTVVLCTATMPLLHAVNSKLGALPPPDGASIISERAFVLKKLKRTTVVDDCRPGGWSNREIVELAQELQSKYRSLLIICNTKKSANQLYDLLKSDASSSIVHLSTNMCPAHRLHKIALIEDKLDPKNAEPIICVSTQLIEAGVDLDFGCVVRSLAGLDSIVQAAGRCNRHGYREMGYVHVLNFKEEKLYASLKDIELAQDITRNRIFQEYRNEPDLFDNDLLSEKAMDRFYEYYFYQRSKEMTYPCPAGKGTPPLAQSCTLLSLLSDNDRATSEASRIKSMDAKVLPFKHAFSTAAQAFQVIDAPTQGVIVPYDEDEHCGSKIITDLAASYTADEVSLADQVRLHKRAQLYTVSAFPHVIAKLANAGAIREIQAGEGIYYLDEQYYDNDLGITLEALSEQHFYQV